MSKNKAVQEPGIEEVLIQLTGGMPLAWRALDGNGFVVVKHTGEKVRYSGEEYNKVFHELVDSLPQSPLTQPLPGRRRLLQERGSAEGMVSAAAPAPADPVTTGDLEASKIADPVTTGEFPSPPTPLPTGVGRGERGGGEPVETGDADPEDLADTSHQKQRSRKRGSK